MTMRRILKVNELKESQDYKDILEFIEKYQKQGDNRRWEEFRLKIPIPLLSLWKEILIDCRRNGFVNPKVWNGVMKWSQVTSSGNCETTDLCTMCERPCQRREDLESGEIKRQREFFKEAGKEYEEPKPCWEEESCK